MQNEEWNVSAVSLSPELVRLAQQKQARLQTFANFCRIGDFPRLHH